ncbi:MAG: hypothetical protein WA842_05825 [Croceibacterium sp.]
MICLWQKAGFDAFLHRPEAFGITDVINAGVHFHKWRRVRLPLEGDAHQSTAVWKVSRGRTAALLLWRLPGAITALH